MTDEPALITTIAIGLTAAFAVGFVARRLRLPTVVGYLVAGVLIGPFTPGFVADVGIATELAEIGVILLMFGVGIHFSFADLVAVRRIAVPGAIGQVTLTTLLGTLLGITLGWGLAGGLVLGLATSVASTVVLLRALGERNELDSPAGRVAVGWLIVQDLLTVVFLVLLPAVEPVLGGDAAGGSGQFGPLGDLALALAKAAVFAVLMVLVGIRVVPALLAVVAREGSRELFTLAVLATALGIAFLASTVFGVSFALGAFLAGAVVSESDMSHQAAAEALPLRDAFAVLFFVSVGMLVDPSYLVANPLAVTAVTAVIVLANAVAAFTIVAVAGHPTRIGLTVAAGVAQIGEFSFIVATLGLSLGLLPAEGFQLIVAGALASITLNPLAFRVIDPLSQRIGGSARLRRWLERVPADLDMLAGRTDAEVLRNHVVICGYGRVARLVAAALERRGFRYVVITDDRRVVERLRAGGVLALYGDAANPSLLEQAHVGTARVVVVAMRDAHAARLIVDRVRPAYPRVPIVVRTHSEREAARFRDLGDRIQAVHGELEVGVQITRYTLRRFGVSAAEAEALAQGMRERGGRLTPAGHELGSRRGRSAP